MRHDEKQAFLCAAGVLLACAAAMPSTLPSYDAGEFSILAVTGGIAHPTGYPLWTLMVRAAAFLRGVVPLVTLLCLLASLCASAAALLMHRAMTRTGLDAALSTVALWATMLAAPSWRNLDVPEPFALNVLLAAAVVFLGARLRERPSAADAAGVGALFGLGFCNHHTLALLLPWALWRVLRAGAWRRHLAAFALGSAAGLLPLLSFLAHGPDEMHAWGDWTDPWAQLVRHVLRVGYGTFSLSQFATRPWWATPWLFLESAPVMLSGVFLLALVAGIAVEVRSRAAGLGVTLTALSLALGLTCLFRLGGSPAEDAVAGRFFVLPLLLLAPPIARGLALAARRFDRLVLPLCGVSLAAHVAIQWPAAERVSETFQETHARNVMALVESPALLVTSGDNDGWAAWYARDVLGLGGDVAILPAALFHADWYVRRVCRQLGLPPSPVEDVLAHALRTRNVYTLSSEAPELRPLLEHSYPLGPLIRVLPPSTDVPGPREVFALNARLYSETLRLPSADEMPRLKIVDRIMLAPYVRPWRVLQPALVSLGLRREADVAREMELSLVPP